MKHRNTIAALLTSVSMLAALTAAVPSAVLAAEYPVLAGDVTLDGRIGVTDLAAMQQYLLYQSELTGEQYGNADLNQDGAVNAFDLAVLKRELLADQMSGTCGETAEWETAYVINDDGTESMPLTISGEGVVDDYFRAPWYPHCNDITELEIASGITELGECSMYGLNQVKTVVLPDTMTRIGRAAFMYCASLESIAIPDSVTVIESAAFEHCWNLKSIALPPEVTEIASLTFAVCESLESVYIPAGVTSIGDSAFNRCTSLQDVYFAGTQEQWQAITIGEENAALSSCTIHYQAQ